MLETGRRALAAGEWLKARRAFERHLESEPGSPEALEGLGWTLFWLDQTDASLKKREEAYRGFLERGDARSAARVATGIAVDSADLRGFAVATGWLERARRHLAGLETCAEHGWLALWEGHLARGLDHDLEKAARCAERAREIASTLDLPVLGLLANALEGLVKVTEGNVREGMRQLDESTAAAVAGEIQDLDSVAATCCFLVHACERVRDLERAAQWGERIDALSARWRIDSVFALCRAEHAAMRIGRGEWQEGESELTEALASLREKRPLVVDAALAHMGELRRRQGRTDEALEIFGRVESNTLAILGTAAIALDCGDALRCADLVERLLRRPLAEKWVEKAMALELAVRARAAAREAGSPDDPLEQLKVLADRVGTEMIRAIAASAEAAAARAAGDHTRARARIEDAMELFEQCGAPWEAARCRIELATELRHLGRESFAREELRAARDAFLRLGAAPHAERASALLEAVVPPAAGAVPLTPREIDVLRLVGRGLSDKEAAASLGLSEHTVHRHVSNILAKLGSPSRTAAAAEAARQGWI